MHLARNLTLLLIVSLACDVASAQSACNAPSADCAAVGELNISVSLGAGTRTNPVGGNSDIPLYLMPQISYYGKRFFLENLEAGIFLHESERHSFNLIATPGYDRVYFVRNDLQNVFVTLRGEPAMPGTPALRLPVPRRQTTYFAGPEWIYRHGSLVAQANALYEVTGEHDGFEVRAALSAPLLESRFTLTGSIGLTWKSAEVVRYYYGIADIYAPGAALNPFVRLAFSRPLSERVSLNAFAHYEHLGDAIARSPLVVEEGSLTVFAGLIFKIL